AGHLLTEVDERAASGKPLVEGLTNAPVDEETVVLKEGKKRRGKRSGEQTAETSANGGHRRV
ncbi:MAG: hypothetical protein L3K13_08895, partial [Thermoplasmata archaeon]|nr:hypothetical protein [Thermoplasmata archaeon]